MEKARERRAGMIGEETDAFRLFDGVGDGVEGVFVDDFAGRWLVSTRDRELPALFREGEGLECRSIWWKRLEQEGREGPEWVWGEREREFEVRESGVRYAIDFGAGYSQGIFLDQRLNRARVAERSGEGQRVLNAFAYTCAFGVVAASAGAGTVNIDLSKRYLEWGKRNYELNGLAVEERDFIYGDVFDWMGRLSKRGEEFGGVILDPPTFSRGEKGKVFRVEKQFDDLVAGAVELVRPGGWLLCCTNCRSIGEVAFEVMIREGVELGGRECEGLEVTGMPPEYTGEKYLKSVWIDVA
ncbi:MAG: class I SAM-dependent methyltransferase [Verrucomicrobiota bacterium]